MEAEAARLKCFLSIAQTASDWRSPGPKFVSPALVLAISQRLGNPWRRVARISDPRLRGACRRLVIRLRRIQFRWRRRRAENRREIMSVGVEAGYA